MVKKSYQSYKINETISIIASRLKNPVAIIKGYIEALIGGDCGEVNLRQKEYLADALFNVKEMSKMIDNILDVSRIEAGEYKLSMQSVSLEDIAKEALNKSQSWAKAANCEIIFHTNKDVPQVVTDPVRIRKVIDNLIANAIKYNIGQGVIELYLLYKEAKKEVVFSCKDNGIGVEKEDYPKIFTKFFRSVRAIEIDPSGLGLGLYINKAIVELSGGKIWFIKNKDKGTTFSFALPAKL